MGLIKQTSIHFVDPRPKYLLQTVAKRYVPRTSSEDGYTLIMTHGTGYHKEHWEPSLERILQLAEEAKFPIREAWSIDSPNHGDSAVLNEKTLQWGYSFVFDWHEYGRGIHSFLTQYGGGTYFPSHKLIGIAHSMGAVGLILSSTYEPSITFDRLVFCEPMFYPDMTGNVPLEMSDTLVNGAKNRRDIWPNKQAALEAFKARKAFQQWDPRVLEIFCEHGLRDLPTANYPDKKDGVTLKCYRLQETACYREESGKAAAFRYFGAFCAKFPTHVVFGDINDYLPRAVHDAIVEAAGGKLRSVERLKDSGHLLVQRKPTELANLIFKALTLEDKMRSKL